MRLQIHVWHILWPHVLQSQCCKKQCNGDRLLHHYLTQNGKFVKKKWFQSCCMQNRKIFSTYRAVEEIFWPLAQVAFFWNVWSETSHPHCSIPWSSKYTDHPTARKHKNRHEPSFCPFRPSQWRPSCFLRNLRKELWANFASRLRSQSIENGLASSEIVSC